MSNAAMWALIVGFFTPIVIGVINQPGWSNAIRSSVAFLVAILIGFVTAYLNGNLEGQTLVSSILLVLVTAISTYKGFWQPTGIVPSIERATSPSDQGYSSRR